MLHQLKDLMGVLMEDLLKKMRIFWHFERLNEDFNDVLDISCWSVQAFKEKGLNSLVVSCLSFLFSFINLLFFLDMLNLFLFLLLLRFLACSRLLLSHFSKRQCFCLNLLNLFLLLLFAIFAFLFLALINLRKIFSWAGDDIHVIKWDLTKFGIKLT